MKTDFLKKIEEIIDYMTEGQWFHIWDSEGECGIVANVTFERTKKKKFTNKIVKIMSTSDVKVFFFEMLSGKNESDFAYVFNYAAVELGFHVFIYNNIIEFIDAKPIDKSIE